MAKGLKHIFTPSSDLSGGKILRQILLFVQAEEAKIPLIVNHALHINFSQITSPSIYL